MTDQSEVAKGEFGDQLVQIFRESIVVVARRGLAGLAKSPAVIGDDAITGFQKNGYLPLPGAPAQRITMDQDHRLPSAVVLIVEINVAGVFLADSNVGHCHPPYSVVRLG